MKVIENDSLYDWLRKQWEEKKVKISKLAIIIYRTMLHDKQTYPKIRMHKVSICRRLVGFLVLKEFSYQVANTNWYVRTLTKY